jgi:hypothetical protein
MNIIQLIFILLLPPIHSIVSNPTKNPSIDITQDHSIGLSWNHSIASTCLPSSKQMPVTTRSMRRRHQLQLSYPESNIVHSSVSNLASDDFSDSVPDLNDQHLSSSSSSDESSTLLLDDEDFKIEISNFQISCGESTPEVVFSSHNLEIPGIVNMESDCADEKQVIHHDPSSSTQDMIFKTLEAISSQMLCNYQHLQDQLTKTASDIQRLTQENETFRSEIRRELENVLPCSPLPAAMTVVPVPSVPTLTSNPDMQSSGVSSTTV